MVSSPVSRKATSDGSLVKPNKRLIVCCDGTQNSDSEKGQPLTNVAKIARCVDDEDTWASTKFIQIVHYQPGVGTGTSHFVNNRDAAIGRGMYPSIVQVRRILLTCSEDFRKESVQLIASFA